MSYAERQDWVLYVRKNGPLNPMLRIEAAIARALLPFLKKGTRLKDLMVWPQEPVAEGNPEKVLQILAAAFKASAMPGKKAKYKVMKRGR